MTWIDERKQSNLFSLSKYYFKLSGNNHITSANCGSDNVFIHDNFDQKVYISEQQQ